MTSCFSSSIASGFGSRYPSSHQRSFRRRHSKITYCSRSLRSRLRSIGRCLPCTETPAGHLGRYWGVHLAPMGMVARIARAFRTQAMIANRSKRPASITTSMRITPLGFAFRQTPDSKLPIQIRSILYSTPSPLNPCTRLLPDIPTSFRRIL